MAETKDNYPQIAAAYSAARDVKIATSMVQVVLDRLLQDDTRDLAAADTLDAVVELLNRAERTLEPVVVGDASVTAPARKAAEVRQ
jgi:hypothetical protein